jgi:hypothetical protein
MELKSVVISSLTICPLMFAIIIKLLIFLKIKTYYRILVANPNTDTIELRYKHFNTSLYETEACDKLTIKQIKSVINLIN